MKMEACHYMRLPNPEVVTKAATMEFTAPTPDRMIAFTH
jgi:hypothetical protein